MVVTVLAIAAAIVIFITIGPAFDWKRFAHSFSRIDRGWLAGSLILLAMTYFGRAVRWMVMIRHLRPALSLWEITKATLIGFMAVTIFGRPGEFVRPYLIAIRQKLPVSSQLATWVLERVYDLLMVLLIFGVGLIQVDTSRSRVSDGLSWVLGAGGYVAALLASVCVAILLILGFFSETAERRLNDVLTALPENYSRRIKPFLANFLAGMASTGDRFRVLNLFLLSVIEWGLVIACSYCLFQSFEPTMQLSIGDTIVFMGFVAFGGVIQIPGVGGGYQVVAVLILTELFGLSVEDAAAAALLSWATMYVVVLPAGFLVTLWDGVTWKGLKTIEETAQAEVEATSRMKVEPQ